MTKDYGKDTRELYFYANPAFRPPTDSFLRNGVIANKQFQNFAIAIGTVGLKLGIHLKL